MRFGYYRGLNKFYSSMMERCMKYVTDSNGIISVDKLHKNGKRIIAFSFVNVFVGLLLLGLGLLSLIMLVSKDQYVLGLILCCIFLLAGVFIANFSPSIFKVGFTFYMTAKCLADDIEISKCPFCGRNISENNNFCGKCGAKIKLQAECSNCGDINSNNARFCKKCGNSLAVKIDNNANDAVKTEIKSSND